jgi:hypothetical protein
VLKSHAQSARADLAIRRGKHQEPLRKDRVGSRQELVARIFLDDHMPQIARGAPLPSTGAFAE